MRGKLWVLVITISVAIVIQMAGKCLISASEGRSGRSRSRKRSVENAEKSQKLNLKEYGDDGNYGNDGFNGYSRRRSYDYSRRRSYYTSDYDRRRSYDYSRRRSSYSSGSSTAATLKYVGIGLTVLGVLIGMCKYCAKTCADEDNPGQPGVGATVEPVPTAGESDLQHVQHTENFVEGHVQHTENFVEAHVQHTENFVEAHVQQNVSYRDEPPQFSAPPAEYLFAYKVERHDSEDIPAMPPPSYEDVVSPNYNPQ